MELLAEHQYLPIKQQATSTKAEAVLAFTKVDLAQEFIKVEAGFTKQAAHQEHIKVDLRAPTKVELQEPQAPQAPIKAELLEHTNQEALINKAALIKAAAINLTSPDTHIKVEPPISQLLAAPQPLVALQETLPLLAELQAQHNIALAQPTATKRNERI